MTVLALVRALLGAVATTAAIFVGTPAHAGPVAPLFRVSAFLKAEPFGVTRTELGAGVLRNKWLALARKLDDERVQLALCDGDRERCVSPAALHLLAIVDQGRLREGRARLGEINRAINLAIRPVSDLAQYGEVDVWSSPLVTFDRGAGDCEDYAIAKLVALRFAGVEAADLRLVIVRDVAREEDHAVAAARLEGRWLILDNQRMAMIQDNDARQVRPLFVIDEAGISKVEASPLMAGVAVLSDQAPAAVPSAVASAP